MTGLARVSQQNHLHPCRTEMLRLPPKFASEADVFAFPVMSTPPSAPAATPTWWQRHGNTAQWVGAIISVIALLGLFANIGLTLWFHHSASQSAQSDEHTNALIGAKFSPLDTRLATLEGKMAQLSEDLNHLTKLQIQKLSAQIQAYKKSKVKLDSAILLRLNDNLNQIAAGSNAELSQAAWKTKAELLSYKSSLNAQSAPSSAKATQLAPGQNVYEGYRFSLGIKLKPGEILYDPHFKAGFIPGPNDPCCTVRLESLSNPQNPANGMAIYFLDLAGRTVILDGEFVRNVVFINGTIAYDGGPVRLENVYFVNCAFEISPQPAASQGLETAILSSSPATTFIHG
jgi:hypothetical protein